MMVFIRCPFKCNTVLHVYLFHVLKDLHSKLISSEGFLNVLVLCCVVLCCVVLCCVVLCCVVLCCVVLCCVVLCCVVLCCMHYVITLLYLILSILKIINIPKYKKIIRRI